MLVVIFVIVTLIYLLLPAVQNARESARRTSCGNNLAQLIIGVHHYVDAHTVCPSGTLNPRGPIQTQPSGYHHNWLVQLLPFLEESVTYRHVDKSVGVYDRQNRPVRQIELPLLGCPSDPHYRSTNKIVPTSYAACHHHREAPIDTTNQGVFFLDSGVAYDDITDGPSFTLFLGEKINSRSGDLGWMSGTRATLRNTGEPINAKPKTLGATGAPAPFSEEMGMGGMDAGMEEAKARQSPDEADRAPAPEALTNARLYVGGFGSHHLGGSQFAFGDGRIKMIVESVDMQTYRQLAHRADGKLLDPGAY